MYITTTGPLDDRLRESRPCDNCGQRPGTEIWAEGTVAFVHGVYAKWCQRCVVSAQLDHAVKMSETIDALREALAVFDASGRLIAPPQPTTPARPSGPWDGNAKVEP